MRERPDSAGLLGLVASPAVATEPPPPEMRLAHAAVVERGNQIGLATRSRRS